MVEYAGSGDEKGAVRLSRAHPYINYCSIRNNSASGVYGLDLSDTIEVKIENSTISNNSASFNGGGIFVASALAITNNTISNNSTSGFGGGIYVGILPTLRTAIIANNTINNNRAYDGGSIYVSWGTETIIINNTISNNSASREGGGIFVESIIATITNNIINNNRATSASAISFNSGSSSDLKHNTITSNEALGSYTIYLKNLPLFRNNNIVNNIAAYELYNANSNESGNLDVTNNFWGTTSEEEIKDKLYDWNDDGSLGIIDYFPYLNALDTTAPISPPENLCFSIDANSIVLTWDANLESDLAGYKVYYDTDASGDPYSNSVDVGDVTTHTLTNLNELNIYYIAITAYDASADGTNDQFDGNESWFSHEVTGELSAPESPVVMINNGAAYTITTSVTLSISANDNVGVTGYYVSESDSTPAQDDEGWTAVNPTKDYSDDVSFTLNSDDGTKTVNIWFKDNVGNISSIASDSIILDSTVPNAPISLDLDASDDTGESNCDNMTHNTSSLTITGSGENGATVQLYDNGNLLSDATCDVSGDTFSIDISLTEGTHSITATQTDAACHTSSASSPLDIIIDYTIAAPTSLDLASDDDTGLSDSDTITMRTTNLTITGEGENGAAVQLYDEGSPISDATGTVTNGTFTIDISLSEGTHSVTAMQTDIAGNISSASAPLAITVDVTISVPGDVVLSPDDDTGTYNNDNITRNTSGLTITGTGENGASVQLYDNGNTISGATGSVSAGTFSIDISLSEGVHSITARQTDVAGNTSSSSNVVNIRVDATASAPTGLDLAAEDDTNMNTDNITQHSSGLTITGSGENDATVQLYDNGGIIPGATATITEDTFFLDISLLEGLHSITAQQTDIAGNISSTSVALDIIIDTTSPSTNVSIGGGTFNKALSVCLHCSDGSGSGCDAIYYTLDGSDLTIQSPQFSDALLINEETTLKFFSIDYAGNKESIKTEEYIRDMVAPTVSITTPQDGSSTGQLYKIHGTASDTASAVHKVELQITDGTWYCAVGQYGLIWIEDESWVLVTGTDSWELNTSNVVWTVGTAYSIKARATDAVGNSTASSISFTYAPGEAAYTMLSLELSSQTILNNSTIEACGKLTRLPDIGIYLGGLTIDLMVKAPDNTITPYTTSTYDTLGHFEFDELSGFTQKGTYTLQATFEGTSLLHNAASEIKPVLVGSSAGYAVLVHGKIASGEGLKSHNKTTNRIYNRMKERGFLDENIYYFNYDTSQDGVDALPSLSEIQHAVKVWAAEKMNGSPAPLWIIMVDHGNTDSFYIDDEVIAPSHCATWLEHLEASLIPEALAEKRIVIIGACYSGSFIQSLSGSGRILVTSAAEDEESYKGPKEPDNIRGGEFFIEEFFRQLGKGNPLKTAFTEATHRTELFTHRGGESANTANRYFDSAAQHPLLEDDGDGMGSNLISEGYGDGEVAENIYLGIGLTYDVNSMGNPAEMVNVTETLYLDASATSARLWAEANDDTKVSSAWMEIRPPSKILTPGGGTAQLEVELDKMLMTLNESSSCWEKTYTLFNEYGMFEVFYFIRDTETDEISPMTRSVVYKNKPENNPPSSFALVSPEDAAEQKTILIVSWTESSDPDKDIISYNLVIATDVDFSNVVYREEGIFTCSTLIDQRAGLNDLTTYYWNVEAVDSYGAITESNQAWSFSTNNTNVLPGFIQGIVYNVENYLPLEEVNISIDGRPAASSRHDGLYCIIHQAGTYTVTAEAEQYRPLSYSPIVIREGGITHRAFGLEPFDDSKLDPNIPQQPLLSSPINGHAEVSLTPTLETESCYIINSNDIHAGTRWQISANADFTALAFDHTSDLYLTSIAIPEFILDIDTAYYWRVKFYDNQHDESVWSDPYQFTTLALSADDTDSNGIPDDQEIEGPVDLDNDGTMDTDQNDIKCIHTVVGNSPLGIKTVTNGTSIKAIKSIDPDTISDTENKPNTLPLGLIRYKLEVDNTGDTAKATIYLSEAANSKATWYTYDRACGWQNYTHHTSFSRDRKSVIVEFQDGGLGDADGIENGVIIHSSGLGQPNNSDEHKDENGCFILTLYLYYPLQTPSSGCHHQH
ncbi:MAG: Ig-like domain-containing protein [bacterium]